jgi:hypothetical protein
LPANLGSSQLWPRLLRVVDCDRTAGETVNRGRVLG